MTSDGIDREGLKSVFSGGPFGWYRLHATVASVVDSRMPIIAAPGLADRHIAITGQFKDVEQRIQGDFVWKVYRHRRSGDLEAWLEGIEVLTARRGGMSSYLRHSFEALGAVGAQRVRCTARDIGGYVLAAQGLEFDQDRLPRFGDDGRGVGPGGEDVVIPAGSDDLRRAIALAIVDAARRDTRISAAEAENLSGLGLVSPASMATFREHDLGQRLLAQSRWPGRLDLMPERQWRPDPDTGGAIPHGLVLAGRVGTRAVG